MAWKEFLWIDNSVNFKLLVAMTINYKIVIVSVDGFLV